MECRLESCAWRATLVLDLHADIALSHLATQDGLMSCFYLACDASFSRVDNLFEHIPPYQGHESIREVTLIQPCKYDACCRQFPDHCSPEDRCLAEHDEERNTPEREFFPCEWQNCVFSTIDRAVYCGHTDRDINHLEELLISRLASIL